MFDVLGQLIVYRDEVMLSVADVSEHQGEIDWDQFAPALDAVIIKAGGGDGRHVPLYTDPFFVRNHGEARNRGLPRWLYFFAGCRTSGREEADFFLSSVADLHDGEALALDYEPSSPPPDPAGWCVEFINRVKEATGKPCLFYTNESRLLAQDWQPVVDTGAGLWVAKYGVNDGEPHTPPQTGNWPFAAAWQYTSKAQMPGVTVNTVDMNQFFGETTHFRAYGSAASVRVESPLPEAPEIVIVAPGDNLTRIAARNGISLARLLELNSELKANPNLIHAGDRVRVR